MKLKNLFFTLMLPASLLAQQTPEKFEIQNNHNFGSKVTPHESVFTPVQLQKTECLSDNDRLQLLNENAQNRRMILSKNPRAFESLQRLTLFQNPIRPKAGFTDYGYHTLQNQVDHNLTPNNNLLDYNCGTRTYDWGNGNHQGTDYILWPYPWKRMQENLMEVVAAAPGIIINKRNNFSDVNCLNNGNPNWNGVVVEHADGSIAIYMHFRQNSATTKEIGDTVSAGEFLGIAGSSGSSTIPHLHFEIRDAQNNVIDPYQGNCNSLNTATWWQQQEAYYVPRINRISTHSGSTNDTACPIVENTYEKTNFATGDPMVLKLYYRDIKNGDVTNIKIIAPNGSIISNFNWAQDWGVFYPTAWAFWTFNVTSSWAAGVYNVEATFGGNTYTTAFGVRTQLSTDDQQKQNVIVYPNPANDILYINKFDDLASIEILDMSGKTVRKVAAELKTSSINVKELIKGNYLLKITDKNGEIKTIKFIKN